MNTIKSNNMQSNNEMYILVNNIIKNINKANLSNILTIINKIDFGNIGYDFDAFLDLMCIQLINEMKVSDNFEQLKQYYIYTSNLRYQLAQINTNKKVLFENYLMKLKSVPV